MFNNISNNSVTTQQCQAAAQASTSPVTYAQIKDALRAALEQHGDGKTYQDYAEMFSATGRQIKSWRTDLINELRTYLPEPRDSYAKQGYRKPKVKTRGEITISANAFRNKEIHIPYGAMLDITYEEEPGDSNCPYKGSRIILTFNGRIGSKGEEEEAADTQESSASGDIEDIQLTEYTVDLQPGGAVSASEQAPANGVTALQ